MSTTMNVVTYQLAYLPSGYRTVDMCGACYRDSAIRNSQGVLGAVERGGHRGSCDACEAGDLLTEDELQCFERAASAAGDRTAVQACARALAGSDRARARVAAWLADAAAMGD